MSGVRRTTGEGVKQPARPPTRDRNIRASAFTPGSRAQDECQGILSGARGPRAGTVPAAPQPPRPAGRAATAGAGTRWVGGIECAAVIPPRPILLLLVSLIGCRSNGPASSGTPPVGDAAPAVSDAPPAPGEDALAAPPLDGGPPSLVDAPAPLDGGPAPDLGGPRGCGLIGAQCCARNTCAAGGCCYADRCVGDGRSCSAADGVCAAGECSGCGQPGGRCCPMPRVCTNGFACAGGVCTACGGINQPCCPLGTGDRCQTGTVCAGGGRDGGGTCLTCGQPGEYCCGTTCAGDGCC